jgi:hypothetical protein
MRALALLALLLVAGQSLPAQHAGQLEIGGFGSYTRFDSRFQLGNQFGAGGRLGFFLGDHFSLEVDANVTQPVSTSSSVGKSTSVFGSASLVITSGGLYALAGYSRLHLGPPAPFKSELNAAHAGLGERIFFVGDRMALRLEARAYYRGPSAGQSDWIAHVTGTAGVSCFLGRQRH